MGRHPQMGAGGHREWGVHLKRHCRWVSVKTVPSKATPTRQHVSGADRFISAVFQAASFRGGSPCRWRASRFRLLNPPNNRPACFIGWVPVASGVGGGFGASSAGGCRCQSVSVADLKRRRRSVSVKDVPSKATSPRQHVSGADRFISAVFQAASSRGGSPPALAGIPISASEPVEQSPGLFLESGAGGIGCRGWIWGVTRKWGSGAIGRRGCG